MDKNKKDPRYRKYESQIERTLSSFEKEINEWADFITFLDKLLKVTAGDLNNQCSQCVINQLNFYTA